MNNLPRKSCSLIPSSIGGREKKERIVRPNAFAILRSKTTLCWSVGGSTGPQRAASLASLFSFFGIKSIAYAPRMRLTKEEREDRHECATVESCVRCWIGGDRSAGLRADRGSARRGDAKQHPGFLRNLVAPVASRHGAARIGARSGHEPGAAQG